MPLQRRASIVVAPTAQHVDEPPDAGRRHDPGRQHSAQRLPIGQPRVQSLTAPSAATSPISATPQSQNRNTKTSQARVMQPRIWRRPVSVRLLQLARKGDGQATLGRGFYPPALNMFAGLVKPRSPLTACLPVRIIFTASSLGDTPPYPTPSRAPKGALVFFAGRIAGLSPRRRT